jgi:hypothetical protein
MGVAVLLTTLPTSSNAVEVYFDQFAPSPDTPDADNPRNPTGFNGVLSSGGAGFALAAADNFLFPVDANLKQVTFWSLEENDPSGGPAVWDKTLRYAIWQDVGNTPSNLILGWGEFTAAEVDQGAVTKTLLRENIQTNVSPPTFFDQYEYSFALETLVGLSANTAYWISIYLGQASNLTNSIALGWQQTSARPLEDMGLPHGNPHVTLGAEDIPPDYPSWLNVSVTAETADLRFQLIADKVPIPSTALLIAPLIGIGLMRSKRLLH